MTSYIEVDGQPVDALNVMWVHYAPCGCMSGLSLAQLPPLGDKDPGMKPRLTVDDVEEDTPKVIRQHEEAIGFHWEAMTRADAAAIPFAQCPHTPQWGVEPDPKMEGMVWGSTDTFSRSGRRTYRRHLIPADRGEKEHPDDYKAAQNARFARKGETVTACGKTTSSYEHWKTDYLNETLACSRCVKAATR